MGTAARVAILPQDSAILRIEEVNLPDPGPTQVVVKQYASGICHSQLHQIHSPRRGAVVLGHESTGVILKTGENVSHVKEGDTVLVTWVPRDIDNAASFPTRSRIDISDGQARSENVFTWADHTIVDEQYVVKADPEIKKDVTSIIGCAVMTGAGAAINTAGVKPGQTVAIFGVGGVGLSAVVGAKKAGAKMIIAIDLDDDKLAFAKQFGATHVINAKKDEPVAAIHALTPREGEFSLFGGPVTGVDFAFDCIGIRQTMEQIVPAVRGCHIGVHNGGTAVLVGVPQTPVELNAVDVLINEKKFIGSIGGTCAPDRDFPTFLKWHKDGDLDLEAMVTKRYTLDQINEAVAALEKGEIAGRAIIEF
jgi:Zn-dependent alcohol dehydrogenase